MLFFLVWEGKLQPTDYELEHPQSREDYLSSTGGRENIEKSAENFASNYRSYRNSKDKNPYLLKFEPPEDKEQYHEIKSIELTLKEKLRGLSPEEQERFMETFRKTNEEAAKKK